MRKDPIGIIWFTDYFAESAIGETFTCNGNKWCKQSTRTARMLEPYSDVWFYFTQSTVIERKFTQ